MLSLKGKIFLIFYRKNRRKICFYDFYDLNLCLNIKVNKLKEKQNETYQRPK